MTTENPLDHQSQVLQRIAPLSGVLVAGLAFAGDSTIGPFPEGTTEGAALRTFYAAHGPHVALGGTLLMWSAICFGIFATSLWARVRGRAPRLIAGIVLLGGAVETTLELYGSAVYQFLGASGADSHIAPAALQAWQLAGTEIGSNGGLALMLVGVAAASFGVRAVPRWLGAIALVLAVALFTPVGFEASLVVLLWSAAVGITLAIRPGVATDRRAGEPIPVA